MSLSVGLCVSFSHCVFFVCVCVCFLWLQVVDIYDGAVVKQMRGHYSQVNTCCFHPFLQELYSGSGDTEILAWTPPPPASLLDNEDDGDDAVMGTTWTGGARTTPNERVASERRLVVCQRAGGECKIARAPRNSSPFRTRGADLCSRRLLFLAL